MNPPRYPDLCIQMGSRVEQHRQQLKVKSSRCSLTEALIRVTWHNSTVSSYIFVIISDACCSTNSSTLKTPPPIFTESFPNNACWVTLRVVCVDDTRVTICSSAVSAGSTVAQALIRSASSRGRNRPTSPSSRNSSRLKRLRR